MSADLPLEIWDHILGYLPTGSVNGLYGVNQALYNISMDARYRDINVDFANLDGLTLHQLQSLEAPDLTCRVRSLKLSPPPHDSEAETDEAVSKRLMKIIPLLPNVQRYSLKWPRFELCSAPYLFLSWQHFPANLIELDLTISMAQLPAILPPQSITFPMLEVMKMLLVFREFTGEHAHELERKEVEDIQAGDEAIVTFVNKFTSTLKELTIRSSPFRNLTDLYLRLGPFPRLVNLDIEIYQVDQRDGPVMAGVINSHSETLQTLSLYHNPDGDVFQIWDSQQTVLNALVLGGLKALTISALHLSGSATFFKNHAMTLKKLTITPPGPVNPHLTSLFDSLHHRNPSHSLTTLSFPSVFFDSLLLDQLATALVRLDSLTLDVRYIRELETMSVGHVLPTDEFPDDWPGTHPTVETMAQYESFKKWKLRNITITRRSCCAPIILWGLMKLCALNIPSISSFVDQGDMIIPDPVNVKTRFGPVTCFATDCTYNLHLGVHYITT